MKCDAENSAIFLTQAAVYSRKKKMNVFVQITNLLTFPATSFPKKKPARPKIKKQLFPKLKNGMPFGFKWTQRNPTL